MKSFEIEAWALKIVDALRKGAPHEDFRSECKAEWIEAKKAARRLAAHCNAAQGEPILWLIGVDRTRGVVGAQHNELSNWWSSVQSEFNEVAPHLTDLIVPADNKQVVALLFETDRAPFVVKSQDGYLEVPWREGTKTNSARRSDLIRILAPSVGLPNFEVMGGNLKFTVQQREPRAFWKTLMTIYVVPRDERRVVIPFHYAHIVLKAGGRPMGFTPKFRLPTPVDEGLSKPSATLRLTNSEMVIDGAGQFSVSAGGFFSQNPDLKNQPELSFRVRPAGAGSVAMLRPTLTPYDSPGSTASWIVGPRWEDTFLPWL